MSEQTLKIVRMVLLIAIPLFVVAFSILLWKQNQTVQIVPVAPVAVSPTLPQEESKFIVPPVAQNLPETNTSVEQPQLPSDIVPEFQALDEQVRSGKLSPEEARKQLEAIIKQKGVYSLEVK